MKYTAVIGTDNPIGLTVVRELGEHGVAVHALGKRPDSIGGKSRHAQKFSIIPDGPIASWLPDFVKRNDIEEVIAISETALVELCHLRGTIPGCTIIAPEPEKLATVLDKQATLAIAAQIGLDTPQSWQPAICDELNAECEALTYPVAVKWSDPVAMLDPLKAAKLPLEKVEYAASAEELLPILRKYDPLGSYPLVQEYVTGYGFGQMLYMHQGKATLRFQHRRLREWPPSGGISTYCASVPLELHHDQMEFSEKLLHALEWDGPAMVEYKFDPMTGRMCLMEINGRFWGSIPLAYHCGAYFAWESWRRAMGANGKEAPTVGNRRARYMVPDGKHLAQQLGSRDVGIADKVKLLAGFSLRLLDPRTKYYVWSWSDPRPFFSDLASMIRKALRRGSA